MSAGLSDQELTKRVSDGDLPLFEVLVRRHNQRVYRTVRSVLKDEAMVEDVMQQTYVQAFSRLGQFTGSSQFSTWLTRIAINEALQRIRKERRWESLEGHDEALKGEAMRTTSPRPQSPEEQAGARELVAFLESALDELPTHYRAVFMLREVEGLDTSETAEVLDLELDAVKQRLHRAKVMLRNALDAKVGQNARELYAFHASRCDRVVAGVLERIGSVI